MVEEKCYHCEEEKCDGCKCDDWSYETHYEQTISPSGITYNRPVLCCEACGKQVAEIVRKGKWMWSDIDDVLLKLGEYLADDPNVKQYNWVTEHL